MNTFAYNLSVRITYKRTKRFLQALLLASVLVYGYFIFAIAAFSAEYQAHSNERTRLENAVSELETRYLEKSDSVDLERALGMGFLQNRNTVTYLDVNERNTALLLHAAPR